VVFGVKPLPVMVITVPDAPEVGLKVIDVDGTAKFAEASIAPPPGKSANTR
jgi:hypothetical protein